MNDGWNTSCMKVLNSWKQGDNKQINSSENINLSEKGEFSTLAYTPLAASSAISRRLIQLIPRSWVKGPTKILWASELQTYIPSIQRDNLLTIKMFLQSSIMHKLINKHTSAFFLAIPKKLYQVSVMDSWKKGHLGWW